MSVSGISASSFFQNLGACSTQSKSQQFRHEFQQLGQDLQSGNLTEAQSDFATLQQNANGSQTSTNNSTLNSTNSPVAQAFNQLSQDLQSGNLTGAQSDFATLQQDLQQAGATQGHPHHHHHHASSAQSSQSDSSGSTINQSFAALGQALQTGNLQAAQQSYSTLQQELEQYSGLAALPTPTTSTASSTNPGSRSRVRIAFAPPIFKSLNLRALSSQTLAALFPGWRTPRASPGSTISSSKPCRYPQPPQIAKDSA